MKISMLDKLLVGLCVLACLVALVPFALPWGCTTTKTTTDADGNVVTTETTIDKDKALIFAKLVATGAGELVGKNNPAAAAAVTLGYEAIKGLDGDVFRKAFLAGLNKYAGLDGIAGSETLRKRAAEILDSFGFDIDVTEIDLPFLQRFDVSNIKAIIIAFIEGMSLATEAEA